MRLIGLAVVPEPVNKNESSWALAHPRNMKMGYHAPAAARATSRCLGTGESVMSLTWELSAPRLVAFEHAEQSRVRGRLLRAAVRLPPEVA